MVASANPVYAARDLAPGEKIVIKREIGRGGFAACYKATWVRVDSKPDATVALKVLLPRFCIQNSLFWTQFEQEANILREINHQNIVSCHGLVRLPVIFPGLHDPYPAPTLAMILEYAEDGTVQSLLQSQLTQPHKQLYDLGQAFRMVSDMASALMHLHGMTPVVVHRDVKLDNMLLSIGEGKRLLVKVSDFGLHTRLDTSRKQTLQHPMGPQNGSIHYKAPQSPASELFALDQSRTSKAPLSIQSPSTATLSVPATPQGSGGAERVYNLTVETGSPMYMAPEVYLHQPYNEKADVFSFAVIMYEVFGHTLLVFTHIGPGKGRLGTTDQYVNAVARQGWRPTKPNALGPDLWRLITDCWHMDPNMRPMMVEVVKRLGALKEAMVLPDSKEEKGWLKMSLAKMF